MSLHVTTASNKENFRFDKTKATQNRNPRQISPVLALVPIIDPIRIMINPYHKKLYLLKWDITIVYFFKYKVIGIMLAAKADSVLDSYRPKFTCPGINFLP